MSVQIDFQDEILLCQLSGEIDHHTALGRALVGTRNTAHRHKQTIRMTVNLAARSIVTIERVSHLERELFCYTYYTHLQAF